LSIFFKDLPSCLFNNRTYKTGINRTTIIECPINGSNPDVTYYKMIPPSTRSRIELVDKDLTILRSIGRYKLYPTSYADFGLYECIPRSLAGTTKCDIHVELGSSPNPPEDCSVQFSVVNNKSFAQFSCKPGFNQGGSVSFLSIYEIIDKNMKLSGRVNIDENKIDKEVPYITPVDENGFYEYVLIQENNYGNSTSIYLSLGESSDKKSNSKGDAKHKYLIAVLIVAVLLFIFLCSSCCCSDLIISLRNDNICCKCCTNTGKQSSFQKF
jgi:hypothetical protein